VQPYAVTEFEDQGEDVLRNGFRAVGGHVADGNPADASGGHRELQLVDDYRRNSDLAPQVARQSHGILSLLHLIESEQPCEDVGLVAVEAKGDVALSVVPEPSTYALVLGGIATLLLIRRRIQA
jgi:hypothetical protein